MQWRYAFVVAMAFLVGAPVHADTKKALQVVPDDALGFVLIGNLKESEERVASLARKVKRPLPISPLDMAKGILNINKGLDREGSALVIVLANRNPGAEPVFVVGLPVSDYAEVAKSLGAEKPGAKMSTVQVMGKEAVIAKKGDFLLASQSNEKEGLERVLKAETGVAKSVAPLEDWLEKNQVSAVWTGSGIKYMDKQLRAALALAKNLADPSAGKMVDMASKALDATVEEVTAFAAGVSIDKKDNVQISLKAIFAEGGSFAKAGAKAKRVESPLKKMPAGEFVFAAGGPYPKELAAFGGQMGIEMLEQQDKKLSKEDVKKLLKVQLKLAGKIKSMAMVMRVGGDTIFDNLLGVMEVDDASAYIKESVDALGTVAATYKKLFKGPVMEVSEVKVNGKAGLEMTTDMTAMTGQQIGPMEMKMIEAMFGKGGKITVTFAVLDKETVGVQYAPAAQFDKTMKLFKQGNANFTSDVGVVATRKLLPEKSQWVAYVSPKGVLDLGRQIMAMTPQGGVIQIPAFPQTPPLGVGAGMDGRGVELRVAIPGAVIGAVGDYIGNLGG